jgi:flagellar basal body-associated protein FliL
MTPFTLITVIVLVLGVALLSTALVLGALLVWTARRIGDANEVRSDLSTLRTDHRNLDEIFESYRKRDAQRVSTSVQRAKKNEETELEEKAPLTREGIVELFQRGQR